MELISQYLDVDDVNENDGDDIVVVGVVMVEIAVDDFAFVLLCK